MPTGLRPYPGLRFAIDERNVEATVFPPDGIRQAPVSPVDGSPMRRADTRWRLEALLGREGLGFGVVSAQDRDVIAARRPV